MADFHVMEPYLFVEGMTVTVTEHPRWYKRLYLWVKHTVLRRPLVVYTVTSVNDGYITVDTDLRTK